MWAFVAAGSQWRNRLLDKQLLIFHAKEARHISAAKESPIMLRKNFGWSRDE